MSDRLPNKLKEIESCGINFEEYKKEFLNLTTESEWKSFSEKYVFLKKYSLADYYDEEMIKHLWSVILKRITSAPKDYRPNIITEVRKKLKT